MGVRELHDELLAIQPEGTSHDADACEFCTPALPSTADDSSGGGDMSDPKTYSQDELDAAIASAVQDAVGPVASELADLRASQEAAEVDARIAEVRAELSGKIETLEGELEAAQSQATEAAQARDDVVAWLEAEKETAEQAALRAQRRDERLAAVKEVASFTDEELEARADRWADMADEDFAALVEDLKVVAVPAGDGSGDGAGDGTNESGALIPDTAMRSDRVDDSRKTSDMSAIRDALRLGQGRADLATL